MKERITGLFSGVTDCFLAGGAITSLYTNKPINDWDIYPKSMKAREEIIQWAFEAGYWCAHASSRALTFAQGEEAKIQIMIFDTFETADKIFDFFDFTVCMGAFDFDTQKFVLHDKFLLHCSQRFLSFNSNTRFPYASAWRVRKYEEKGFTIGKMEYFKILLACQNRPINTWEDLKDQVGGVYGESMEIPTDEPYSLERAIDVISNMKPCGAKGGYSTAEEAIACTSGREIPYFINDRAFGSKYWAQIHDDEWVNVSAKPTNGRQVGLDEVFPGLIFYKKVLVDDQGVYRSIYDRKFIYTVGEYAEASSPHIYCYGTVAGARSHMDYRVNKQRCAILTLSVDSVDDIVFDATKPQVKRCKVVAAEEYI